MGFDYGIISGMFNDFDIGAGQIVVPLIVIAVSIIAITRSTREAKLLAFPMSIGYARIGLPTESIIIIALGLILHH